MMIEQKPKECLICRERNVAWDDDMDNWFCQDCHLPSWGSYQGKCTICQEAVFFEHNFGIRTKKVILCDKESCSRGLRVIKLPNNPPHRGCSE